MLHVGPSKTATTYLQGVIYNHKAALQRENFYWPDTEVVLGEEVSSKLFEKSHAYLAKHLLTAGERSDLNVSKQIKHFFHEARNFKRNIIIFEETLGHPSDKAVRYMAEMFVGFEVTVLMNYRSFISHIISLYIFRVKDSIFMRNIVPSFGSFLHKTLDDLFSDISYLFDKYASVFGQQNVKIIDYDGVLATGKTLTHVFFCDVLKVLCDQVDRDELIHEKTRTENITAAASHNLTNIQLNFVFDQFMQARNCLLTDFYRLKLDRKGIWQCPPPVISSNLTYLKRLSSTMDVDLRRKYHSNILYGNRTAVLQSLQKLSLVEVDTFRAMNDIMILREMDDKAKKVPKNMCESIIAK